MKFFSLITVLILSQFSFSQEIENSTPDYPVAEKIPFYFVNHGDTVLQNYNWMRKKDTPEIINYLEQENTYSDVIMKPSSILQKKIFEEMRSVMKENNTSRMNRVDNYYYYSKWIEGKEQSIQYRKKDSITAKEQIVLDANVLAQEFGYFTIAGYKLSEDHSLLAYSVNTVGGDYGSVYTKNIDKDSTFKDYITRVNHYLLTPDNKSIYYVKEDLISKRANQLFVHVLGTDTLTDKLILKIEDSKFNIGISISTSKQYIFISTSTFGMTGDYYVIDLLSNDLSIRKIYTAEKGIETSFDHIEGDYFLVTTNKNAPDYLIKEIDDYYSFLWINF